jgi:hypothetical protein
VPKFDKYEEDLMHLMFGLAESLAEAPEPDILGEAGQNRVNLLDEAEEVRGIMRSAGRQYLQRRLRKSRQAYETAVAEMKGKHCDLPEAPAERRQLLNAILRERPDLEPIVMTAQHRNFNELTDEDVTSFLRQLKILGLTDLPAEPTQK